jgi:hypothetical protein
VILPRTIAMWIALANGEVQGGCQGDDSNVKAVTVDHPVRCLSRGNGVGECEPDSKIGACRVRGEACSEIPHNEEGVAWVSPADRDRDLHSANQRMFAALRPDSGFMCPAPCHIQ